MSAGATPARETGGSAFAASWELVRPFTLVAPALGMLSGSLTAYGARPRFEHGGGSPAAWLRDVAVGALAAALLNGASNVLNQVCDLPADRINKASRVLPRGRLSPRSAVTLSAALYAASLAAAATINVAVLSMFALGALATVVYSVPPLRTKRFGWWANLTIAIPRGVLLKVAGWSVTKPLLAPEAWLIGAIFGLFLLGATTSKDFADVEGDRADGSRTLPVVYGRQKATRMIKPFFTAPFLLLAAGGATGVFTGNRIALVALGLGCAAWGHAVIRMLERDPVAHLTENHPSWRHMYYLMFTLQLGFVAAYLLPGAAHAAPAVASPPVSQTSQAPSQAPYPLGPDNAALTVRARWRTAMLSSGTLDAYARASLDRGRALFLKVFTPEDGVGPYFNDRSCLGCHSIPSVLGHGPITKSARVYNTGRMQRGGAEELASRFLPYETLPGHPSFAMPSGFKLLGNGRPPPLRGLGWIEAVDAEQILAQPHCDPPIETTERVCGWAARRAIGPGTVRFGVKMGVATIEEFAAGALALEMGLTTAFPIAPTEPLVSDPELPTLAVIDLANFIALSPPPAAATSPEVAAGAVVFEAVGCKDCHWSRFEVAGRPTPQMYTDILAHYMGPDRAEAGYDHLTPPGHYRTTPLWGLGQQVGPYLHDGAAATLEEAISLHGGEATGARARVRALDDASRRRLLAMLRNL